MDSKDQMALPVIKRREQRFNIKVPMRNENDFPISVETHRGAL